MITRRTFAKLLACLPIGGAAAKAAGAKAVEPLNVNGAYVLNKNVAGWSNPSGDLGDTIAKLDKITKEMSAAKQWKCFHMRLVVDGGSSGNQIAAATYTYRVISHGEVIAHGVPLEIPRLPGPVHPAVRGIAYWDGGKPKLWWVDEPIVCGDYKSAHALRI